MRNIDRWTPTKFIKKKDNFRVSNDEKHVNPYSRLMAKYVIDFYSGALPKYAKGTLIDLGCGNVPLYEVYKKYVDNVICLDWPNSLHESQHIDITADLNQPLILEGEISEIVVLSDVLEHIYNPELLLKEINRVLKIEGVLIMNVPFMYWIHESPYDFYRFTEFALKKIVRDSGFRIIEFHNMGGTPDIICDQLSKLVWRAPLFGRTFAKCIQNSSIFLSDRKYYKKLSKSSSINSPFAYGLIAIKE